MPRSDYRIAADSLSCFDDRLVVISGVGRSGTSILGKLFGSLDPVFYLFEPAIMQLLPSLSVIDPACRTLAGQLLRTVLFEDHFLPLIHGRSLNFNRKEQSYFGHYMFKEDIEDRWRTIRSRRECLDRLAEVRPVLAVKTTEFCKLFSLAQEYFQNPRFIHIIRNGNDVIASSLARGWYSDHFLAKEHVAWGRTDTGQKHTDSLVPWFVAPESRPFFLKWSPATRVAHVWRTLTESGREFAGKYPESCFELRYEELVTEPMKVSERLAQVHGLTMTSITQRHIDAIRAHVPSRYPLMEDSIEPPERDQFIRLMSELGYC